MLNIHFSWSFHLDLSGRRLRNVLVLFLNVDEMMRPHGYLWNQQFFKEKSVFFLCRWWNINLKRWGRQDRFRHLFELIGWNCVFVWVCEWWERQRRNKRYGGKNGETLIVNKQIFEFSNIDKTCHLSITHKSSN